MKPLPHRVRLLSLRVHSLSTQSAFLLRKELRDRIDVTLFPALSRACDDSCLPGEIRHIQRIELKLAVPENGDFAEELAKCAEQELRRMLASARAVAEDQDPADTAASPVSGEHRDATPIRQPTMNLLGSDGTTSWQSLFPMLVEYLKAGSLAWPLVGVPSDTVRREFEHLARTKITEVISRLTDDLGTFESLVVRYARYLQLLPESQWISIAETVCDHSQTSQGSTTRSLLCSLVSEFSSSLDRYARIRFVAIALAGLQRAPDSRHAGELRMTLERASADPLHPTTPLLQGSGKDETEIGTEAQENAEHELRPLRSSSSKAEALFKLPMPLADVVAAIGASEPLPQILRTALSGGLKSQSGPPSDPTPVATVFPIGGRASVGGSAEQSTHTDFPLTASADSLLQEQQTTEAVGMSSSKTAVIDAARQSLSSPLSWSGPSAERHLGQVVRCAGLVLIHPFLSRFLENRGVKEPGQSELALEQIPRAAALLYHLATGGLDPCEFDLDFIKILLGQSLEYPLPVTDGLLDDADRLEVSELLTAVVSHWQVLKKTTVDTLRSTFLQRGGIFHEGERELRVRVESAPFDVLLGQLPWGIGTVKLPWMKKIMFTEWPPP